MSNSRLTHAVPVSEDGPWDRKEFTKQSDGTYTVGVRAAARMAGCNDGSLGRSLRTGAAETPSRLATFLLAQGVEGAASSTWSETGIPETGLVLILEYFAFETATPRAKAKQFLRTFTAARRILTPSVPKSMHWLASAPVAWACSALSFFFCRFFTVWSWCLRLVPTLGSHLSCSPHVEVALDAGFHLRHLPLRNDEGRGSRKAKDSDQQLLPGL